MTICFSAVREDGSQIYRSGHHLRTELDVSNSNGSAIIRLALGLEFEYCGTTDPVAALERLEKLDTLPLRKAVVGDRLDLVIVYVLKLMWVCRQAIKNNAQLGWS